ncbi:hypothetical protein HYR99_30505 [Candidatus Poribacteria bacterium]|nr:hypothetical protein [Candidatus Poribacteria bacterium]
MARGAEIQRRRIVGRGGKGYGRGHREEPSVVNKGVLSVRNQNTIKLEEVVLMTQERFYPSKPTSEVEMTLARIGEAILLYEEQTGKLPHKLPDVCKVVGPEYPIRPNSKGDILDAWGAPIIYCVPGKIYVNRFDLYSRGECGVDHGGEEPNILYLLDRR